MKNPYSFKLEPEIIPALKSIAESENRSLNNLVETVLRDFIQSRGGGVKKGIIDTKKAKN